MQQSAALAAIPPLSSALCQRVESQTLRTCATHSSISRSFQRPTVPAISSSSVPLHATAIYKIITYYTVPDYTNLFTAGILLYTLIMARIQLKQTRQTRVHNDGMHRKRTPVANNFNFVDQISAFAQVQLKDIRINASRISNRSCHHVYRMSVRTYTTQAVRSFVTIQMAILMQSTPYILQNFRFDVNLFKTVK
jgi:hypothetical protein